MIWFFLIYLFLIKNIEKYFIKFKLYVPIEALKYTGYGYLVRTIHFLNSTILDQCFWYLPFPNILKFPEPPPPQKKIGNLVPTLLRKMESKITKYFLTNLRQRELRHLRRERRRSSSFPRRSAPQGSCRPTPQQPCLPSNYSFIKYKKYKIKCLKRKFLNPKNWRSKTPKWCGP